MTWTNLLHNLAQSSAFKGAVTGLVGAAIVDYHAFTTWKSLSDVKTYQWGTAAFRWLQGAVSGAISGAGYGALVG